MPHNKELKFLVDDSFGTNIYIFLRGRGFDARYLADFMTGSSDLEVLKFAEKEGRILITNDKDFGDLAFGLKRPSARVILLRLKENNINNIKMYLSNLLEMLANFLRYNLVVVEGKKIRIGEENNG